MNTYEKIIIILSNSVDITSIAKDITSEQEELNCEIKEFFKHINKDLPNRSEDFGLNNYFNNNFNYFSGYSVNFLDTPIRIMLLLLNDIYFECEKDFIYSDFIPFFDKGEVVLYNIDNQKDYKYIIKKSDSIGINNKSSFIELFNEILNNNLLSHTIADNNYSEYMIWLENQNNILRDKKEKLLYLLYKDLFSSNEFLNTFIDKLLNAQISCRSNWDMLPKHKKYVITISEIIIVLTKYSHTNLEMTNAQFSDIFKQLKEISW